MAIWPTTSTHTVDIQARVTSEQYPCDRGYGDGLGRSFHHFVAVSHWGNAACTYCGKRAVSEPLKVTCGAGEPILCDLKDTKASGGSLWLYEAGSFNDPTRPTVAELNAGTNIPCWVEQ